MPTTWELRGSVLVVTVVGEYDPWDFDRIVVAVKSDPRYRPGLTLLYDARRCEAFVTTQIVEEWSDQVVVLPPQGFSKLCAIVVADDPYRFGMARMAAAHLAQAGVELLVTRDFDAALGQLAG